jgi:hypothetical protein
MEGFIPGSNSLRLGIALITIGLAKAMNTDDAVCIPSVPIKVSMLKPIRKEAISNSQPGVSKGSNRIK